MARFLFHPWMPINNTGKEGFAFTINLPELARLSPLPAMAVTRPHIMARKSGSLNMLGTTSYVGSDTNLNEISPGAGGMVPTGAGAPVEQRTVRPEVTVRDLTLAFGDRGMQHLSALDAADEVEFGTAFVIFEAVMEPGWDEKTIGAGRRHPELLLEHFPVWLQQGAPRALEHALANGVLTRQPIVEHGRIVNYKESLHKVPRSAEQKGLKLIDEVRASITRAIDRAVGPENGVLVRTRRMMQAGARGAEGKTHFDSLDLWLLQQFPSFDMDTDTERAALMLKGTMEESNKGSEGTAQAILTLAEQLVRQGERTDMILELLMEERKQAATERQRQQTAEQKPKSRNAAPEVNQS
jgi:hypothetical protein